MNSVSPRDQERFHLRLLLQHIPVWCQTMIEAVDNIMPCQMRNTFVNLLVFANVMDPLKLWEEFHDRLFEDYTH